MLSGTVPFKANNMNELHKLIIRGNYQPLKEVSEEAQSLLTALLEIDPKRRISIDQILNHPWIRTSDNKFRNKCKITIYFI
jgi:serine/threonine protein kinase